MNDAFPPPALDEILRRTPGLERSYLVGGCVRDRLIGVPVKDYDVEVYGIGYEALAAALSRRGRADLVGKAFGVVKLSHPSGAVWDFSLPRRDSKRGPGHRGFEVEFDPDIRPEEASARRDFTINALMWDPRAGRLLDFHGGEEDLRRRVLRHVGPAFVEDPLRVLRGMQFSARYRLDPAPETSALCRTIAGAFPELPAERVREEWFKWASLAVEPSRGLRFLAGAGWLGNFPELAALVGVPQDPVWHPEGDVWTHTGHCLDALVKLDAWSRADAPARIALSLAVLLHDVAKPACTRREARDGVERIVSPGHEVAGGPVAETFLARLACPAALRERILPLIRNHMVHAEAPSPRMIRRLADRLRPATIGDLAVVMTADASGRPPLPAREPASVRAILDAAAGHRRVGEAPRPILLGRHLLDRGHAPGPAVGGLLKRAYEAQLDGEFVDLAGALNWLASARRDISGAGATDGSA